MKLIVSAVPLVTNSDPDAMQPARLVALPIDHVLAEIAAFPLASESALHGRLTQLTADLSGATAELWRAAERETLGHFPGVSVDEVVAIRDKLWFADQPRVVPLHAYLRRLARMLLETHGAEAFPRLSGESVMGDTSLDAKLAQTRRQWRWLAFALPPDLLLAALGGASSAPTTINLLAPALERQLAEGGIAETHLHLGAALDFPSLWVGALHRIAHPDVSADAFTSPGAGFEEGRSVGPWLIAAALARYVLGQYLSWGQSSGDLATFLASMVYRRISVAVAPSSFALLLRTLTQLRLGLANQLRGEFRQLQALYAQLSGVRPAHVIDQLDRLQELDPLAELVPHLQRGRLTPELRFVALGLSHLDRLHRDGRPDPLFVELFWQVVRVRCLFYRHVVQRPMTPGLQWFVRFYGRLRPARDALATSVQLESAARLGGRGRGLRSLELRTSPEASRTNMAQFVADVDRICRERFARDQPTWELGLVFHFTKDRGGGARQGTPWAFGRSGHADPQFNPTGYRFARFFESKRREAMALAWLLKHYPWTLEIVRGVDVCTDELGVPNWVFTSLLAEVRAAGETAAVTLAERFGTRVPMLRTSVHAGEDFVHLLGGLRLVDEAIEHLGLREGDRLGHALALGIDARTWARRAGRLALSIEERLFDLVWQWSWYARQSRCRDAGLILSIEYEIAQWSARIWGQPITPYSLQQLRDDLANARALQRLGFPNGPEPVWSGIPDSPERAQRVLLYRFLTDHEVFRRGREIVWLDPSHEESILADLQAELRQKVGASALVVEINPTSNLLIGDLEDLTAHPLWRLRPPQPLPGDPPPVAVCVGSDDPLVFNSSLPQEYQCLSDALLLAGLSDEQARQWLERTRQCGLESRFTVSRPRRRPVRWFYRVGE